MKYYLINVHWTTKADKDIISSFIVETTNAKDAINQVLFKHSFLTLNDDLKVFATEIGTLLRTHNTKVYAVANTVLNE